MIHLRNLADIYSAKYCWIWLLSAFKAGFLNSAGFLATGNFVSHVTGFGTQVGIAIGHQDYIFGFEILIIPISFIMGGVITSLILDRDLEEDETPPYHIVQGIITLLIAFVIFIGENHLVNFVPDAPHDARYNIAEFAVITLLCLICGLKNSLVTWATQGKIRVTHLTGLSTDIGLNLIRTLKPQKSRSHFKEKKIVNVIRLLTLLSFSVGACSSAIIFPKIGYKGFFIIMVISLLMTLIALIDKKKQIFNHSKEASGHESTVV